MKNILQSIRGMGIVHNNGKILTATNQLKTTRHTAKLLQRCLNEWKWHSLSHSGSRRCHYVIYIENTSNL